MTNTNIRFEIRNSFALCGYGLASEIADCYDDDRELSAKTAEEAVKEAEALQEKHDAAALKVIESMKDVSDSYKMRDMRESYENAPAYASSLYKITTTDDDEVVEKVEA